MTLTADPKTEEIQADAMRNLLEWITNEATARGLCTNVSRSQWQRYGRRVTGGVKACENAEMELTHRKFAHRRAWDQRYP